MSIVAELALLALCGCSDDPLIGDFDIKLIGDYRLIRTSVDMVNVVHMKDLHRSGIPAKVVELAWNRDFIAAKQQDLKDRGDFPGDNLQVPVPGSFHFWIIDARDGSRYGPLTPTQFDSKLKSLGQTDLKLRPVSRLKQVS